MSFRSSAQKIAIFLLSCFILIPSIAVAAKNRVALVIGNSKYEYFDPLKNPSNDARDISKTLEDIGFDVIKVLDASNDEMFDALHQFEKKLTPGSISVIFYAGHGIQSSGENYLIPVSANIEQEYQLNSRTMSVSDFLRPLNTNKSGKNLVILDACRDNPLAESTRSGNKARGLAKIKKEPANTMIIYATQANETAADGSGENGLFTKHLLRAMRNPSNSFISMFDAASEGVAKESNYKQRPALYTSFGGTKVSLHPNWTPKASSISQDEDTELYLTIKNSNDKSDFEEYLERYPNGKWVSDALAKIEELNLHSGPNDKASFVFTSPQGSKLIYKGRSEPFADNQTELFLSEGNNIFTLKMKNGRKIYGNLSLNHLDEKVLNTIFGLDEKEGPLPKEKHIKAAMRGSPVQYRITMNTNSGVRQVINYRLSLRPIRN